MLDTVFLQILDLSKIASIVILAVLFVRLCLKRAPKVFSYALWAVVLFRLLCPFALEAPISLIPQTQPTAASYDLLHEPITPLAAMDAAQQAVGDVLNGGIGVQHVSTTALEPDGTRRIVSTDWRNVWLLFGKYAWAAGMACLLISSTVSYSKLHRKLLASVKLKDNIYLADDIDSPFVTGLIHPKIYLPSSLPETERHFILLHEQYHIRHGDHIVKLLSFIALCLHWFNPLVWAAFILSGKDMEMRCDEAVLRTLGTDIRVAYSASLIRLSTGRRMIAGTPLAFGEGDTVGRVKNIAAWKKPAIWVTGIAVAVCTLAAVCLITNPINRETTVLGAEYRIAEVLYHTQESYNRTDNDTPSICITADLCLWVRDDGMEWTFVGQMEPYALDGKELKEYTAWEKGWRRKYRTDEITDAYILHIPNDQWTGMMYIAFRAKNGDLLLGYGAEDISERGQGPSDDSSFFCLYRLESTFSRTHLSGTFHERSLAQRVGGDVEIFHTWSDARIPGYMIVGFYADNSPYREGTQVPSPAMSDMGYAVFYHDKNRSGYRLLQYQVYKDAAKAENGIFYCDAPAVLDLHGEMIPDRTFDIVLLNNDSIEKAVCIWNYPDGSEKTEVQSHLTGHNMVLFSRENGKDGCSIRHYFYDENGTRISEESGENPIQMIPTTANINGAFDSYLYVPIDGSKYRFERIDKPSVSVTKDKLIYTFVEDTDPSDVFWYVYSLQDTDTQAPIHSMVLAERKSDFIPENTTSYYRYSPSKAVDPDQLTAAKAAGMVTMEDGDVTYGLELWNDFYRSVLEGKAASVNVVHYYTMEDPSRCSKTYYDAYKEDYPAMYTLHLSYDGEYFNLDWNESDTQYRKQYKYLMRYEDTIPSYPSSQQPREVVRYILTHDNTVTLDALEYGLASSRLGDYIPHTSILTDIQ